MGRPLTTKGTGKGKGNGKSTGSSDASVVIGSSVQMVFKSRRLNEAAKIQVAALHASPLNNGRVMPKRVALENRPATLIHTAFEKLLALADSNWDAVQLAKKPYDRYISYSGTTVAYVDGSGSGAIVKYSVKSCGYW